MGDVVLPSSLAVGEAILYRDETTGRFRRRCVRRVGTGHAVVVRYRNQRVKDSAWLFDRDAARLAIRVVKRAMT